MIGDRLEDVRNRTLAKRTPRSSLGSRAGALLARQSQVLENDEAMDVSLAEQRRRIETDPSIVAPSWAVYAVKLDEIEFWQANEERRHIRLRYRRLKDGLGWAQKRLWP